MLPPPPSTPTAPAAPSAAEFTRAVEARLQLLGAAFELRHLISFVADAWPLIRDDPDPARWARAFLEGRREAAAGRCEGRPS